MSAQFLKVMHSVGHDHYSSKKQIQQGSHDAQPWKLTMLMTGGFLASPCSSALAPWAFHLPIIGHLALALALRLLLVCLCRAIQQGLLGQQVCELQLEAGRQVAPISFAPCQQHIKNLVFLSINSSLCSQCCSLHC